MERIAKNRVLPIDGRHPIHPNSPNHPNSLGMMAINEPAPFLREHSSNGPANAIRLSPGTHRAPPRTDRIARSPLDEFLVPS